MPSPATSGFIIQRIEEFERRPVFFSLHALQLLPCSPDASRYASDGSGHRRSCLGDLELARLLEAEECTAIENGAMKRGKYKARAWE
jgi:hypothetical protein